MAIGFKEWLDVCAHLGAGTTSLILRKGGIHEGRAGFSFKHERFFLFPTGFHQAAEGLTRPAPPLALPPSTEENGVSILHFAVAEWAEAIRDRQVVAALAPLHVYAPQVVDERFNYSEKLEADCISVAFVRIYQLPEVWHFPYRPGFGGCRSWVDLPEPPDSWEHTLQPVVSDAEHERRAGIFRALVG
jgi:hypothetical protein